MTRLPRDLDELRGLRVARWVRESTGGQYDTFGPEAQREQQDRAIERYGLADTGLAWSVAHSGRTVDRTPAWAEMIAAAGRDYDVPADRAVAWLQDFAALRAEADEEERAELTAAVYEEVTVRGPEFVSARLTPAAYAHGLALALPERVPMACARPTGVARAAAIAIPIEGAREWRRAARRAG